MTLAKVTTSVVDLSTRVTANSSYNAAIVVASNKGPVNTPQYITSQTAFLQKYTPDEQIELGDDTSLYEAYEFLSECSGLYVIRAANIDEDSTPALYGGCNIRMYNSSLENSSLEEGFVSEDNVPFDDYAETALVIYGSSQGAWNDDISVVIITDPDKVKLDGCFIIKVYKKGVLVETHTCSLDPSLKNGYGVNCYAETILTASNYIRADVNDEDDNLLVTAYEVEVTGTVTFDNETITTTSTARINHTYAEGDIIKVTELDDITAYYECTTSGTSSSSIPSFVEDDEYVTTLTDGTVTWTLSETVQEHELGADYTAGNIVYVSVGSNKYYYRAKTSGTTALTEPTWIDDDNAALYTVEDGDITWTLQTQTETVSTATYYTYASNVANAKLDLTKYSIYEDEYCASEVTLDETVNVEDPTTVDNDVVTAEVTYTAVYTGNTGTEHYCLPKASDYSSSSGYTHTYLYGGSNGASVTDSERITALKTLNDMNAYDVQLIMDGGNTTAAYASAIADVCENREDSCHGILSTPYANEMGMVSGDALTDLLDYRKETLSINSYNMELYTTHQLIYDEFNDRNVYVSPSCFVAAQILKIAKANGWYYPSAGPNYGVIDSLEVANSYDDSTLDELTDDQINPIVDDATYGHVIMDDLTLYATACDLQECHISRYVNIYLRPALKKALKAYLFEFNDTTTRDNIKAMIETFMLAQGRALYDYKIVCDETNNTDSDIENSILNCWLYIKPVKLSKWINQKIIISPYGTEFDDLSW